MKAISFHSVPQTLHRQPARVGLRGKRRRKAGINAGSLDKGGDMPYEYDQKELQELADLMPPPLEASPLPSSKNELRRLLEKHGVRCDATFGTNYFEDLEKDKAQKSDLHPDFDDLWPEEQTEDEAEVAWREEEISEEEANLIQMTEFGYECMRDFEYGQIFTKAMELHHSQRERSRNHFATTMWYAKKLEQAEMQDNYEIADKNPIPTFIRAMFTLEEEFEELNKKQYDVEVKMQEYARDIEEAEYREFLKGTVINLPTKPGSQYHDIFNPPDEEKEEEEEPIDIDVYLHGILPNAKSDEGLPEKKKSDPDAYLHELMFKEDEMD